MKILKLCSPKCLAIAYTFKSSNNKCRLRKLFLGYKTELLINPALKEQLVFNLSSLSKKTILNTKATRQLMLYLEAAYLGCLRLKTESFRGCPASSGVGKAYRLDSMT